MNAIIITDASGLIEARITPKTETYYLLTNDNIRTITASNIFTDFFTLIASLAWGAYFSVIITLDSSTALVPDIKQTLEVYRSVFLSSAIIFSVLALAFLVRTNIYLQWIKRSKYHS